MGVTLGDRVRYRWVRIFGAARYDRLEGSLDVAKIEIQRRIDVASPTECWSSAATNLLNGAQAALAKGRLDQGWKLLQSARRMEIFGLDGEALRCRATVLRTEADKLNAWRRKTVERLLGTVERPEPIVTPGAIYDASLTRDEHYDNQAHKEDLLRTHMLTLGLSLAVLVILVSVILCTGRLTPPASEAVALDLRWLGAIVTFGLLGGTVSAMVRSVRSGESFRIPELTAAMRVTFMRIGMGGASALALYVFLRSDVGENLASRLFSSELATAIQDLRPFTVYTLGFVAGFSERLVTRAVEKIAGAGDDRGKAKAEA
jgi:hypothetical protein